MFIVRPTPKNLGAGVRSELVRALRQSRERRSSGLSHDRQIDCRERFLPRQFRLVVIEEGGALYGKELLGLQPYRAECERQIWRQEVRLIGALAGKGAEATPMNTGRSCNIPTLPAGVDFIVRLTRRI